MQKKTIDFLIIGAMKCGTSSLFNYLTSNPAVAKPPHKELRFFERDDLYSQGIDAYHAHWPTFGVDGAFIRGEASPQYTYPVDRVRVIVDRIFKYDPNLKLIYLVRHPIKRILSHWRHGHRANPEKYADFEKNIQNPEDRAWFVERTRYLSILNAYLEYFPRENIKVVFFDDLVSSPMQICAEIEQFIGIPAPAQPGPFPKKNVTVKRGAPVDQTIIASLITELEEEMAAFLAFCGKPSDFWDMSKLKAYTV